MSDEVRICQVVAHATPPSLRDEKEMRVAWSGWNQKTRTLFLRVLMSNPSIPEGDPDTLALDNNLLVRQEYALKMQFWAVYKGLRDLSKAIGIELSDIAEGDIE